MSAEAALFDAYGEWRRLTRAAHLAISRRDWNFLAECQRTTQRIQPLISQLTAEARKEWRQGGERKGEDQLHSVIDQLKGLLESNRALLHSVRAAALSKRKSLEEASRNLRRLQSAYRLSHPPGRTLVS